MGLIFSLVYIAIAILSPALIVPWLAPYHIQVWLGLATIIATIPAIPSSNILSVSQVRLLGLVVFGIVGSFVFNGWLGGTLIALNEFIPNAIVLFFVLLNFRSLSRLRWLALLLVSCSLYIVVRGMFAYAAGDPNNPMIYVQRMEDQQTWFPRLRAFGFLNDPNDLAQFLITVLPLIWLNWRAKQKLRNFALVVLPASVLIVGIFLTHSRGAMIALAVIILFAFRHVLGMTWSLILAGGGFAVASLLNFSGGRDVSVEAGAGRIEAWGAGIGMLISHPVFGVGYSQFYDYYEIAAHNTFIHCAAELGFFGYFFWMALVVFSLSDLSTIANAAPKPMSAGRAANDDDPSHQFLPDQSSGSAGAADTGHVNGRREHESDLKRWATAIQLGFVGYLSAGTFISRSYVMTLFLLLGCAAALRMIAIGSGTFSVARPPAKLFRITGLLVVASLFWIYVAVRIRWM
jgi:hypothetical protein